MTQLHKNILLSIDPLDEMRCGECKGATHGDMARCVWMKVLAAIKGER